NFTTRELLTKQSYFPKINPQQYDDKIQLITSGPLDENKAIALLFHKVITTAKEKIYLQTPYFLPSSEFINSLQIAALSGIDVRIMLPEHSDSPILQMASHSYISQILRSGVKVYFYKKGFMHAKAMIIDNKFTTIGSTNFDFRSFEQNFEVNAFIYSTNFNSIYTSQFTSDLQNCRRIMLRSWKKRPLAKKIRESVSRLLSPVL
ncbi:MAG: phospholipase D-like domain-containing protein, partial [Bacteroidales bacterium]